MSFAIFKSGAKRCVEGALAEATFVETPPAALERKQISPVDSMSPFCRAAYALFFWRFDNP